MAQLEDQALKIVENVLFQCMCEAFNKRVFGRLISSYMERASLYTGLPRSVLLKVNIKPPCEISETATVVWLEARKILRKFYSKQEQPTVLNLYDMLKAHSELDVPDFDIFKLQLMEWGYENIQLLNSPLPGEMIVENPKVTFERYHYIKKVMKARTSNKKIYYLSVKVYDIKEKCMVPLDTKQHQTTQQEPLILYHVVSRDGYEDSLYTYSFDPQQLITWVLNIVIPLLEQSSLMILDKVSFCRKSQNISRYHPKKDMIMWLKHNNLPCDSNMHKAELFELIEKCCVKLENNFVEDILKSMGHNVLYLPKQINNLSPIELVWKDLNIKLKEKHFKENIRAFIDEEISSVSSNGLWAKYDTEIQQAEQAVLKLDSEIENYLEKYEINLDQFDNGLQCTL